MQSSGSRSPVGSPATSHGSNLPTASSVLGSPAAASFVSEGLSANGGAGTPATTNDAVAIPTSALAEPPGHEEQERSGTPELLETFESDVMLTTQPQDMLDSDESDAEDATAVLRRQPAAASTHVFPKGDGPPHTTATSSPLAQMRSVDDGDEGGEVDDAPVRLGSRRSSVVSLGRNNSMARSSSSAAAAKHRRFTSVPKAAFHIFKGNVGVGIFLLPMVYNDAGFIFAPLLGCLVGLLVVDATFMLVQVKRSIANERVASYPDIVRYVFGRPAQKAVNGMIVVIQLGFCLLYVQTAAGIFEELFPFRGAYLTFVLLEFLFLTPLLFLTNNLSVLAVSSMVATVLVFTTVVATFGNALRALSSDGIAPTVTATGSLSKWSLFFASSLTVLEGVCVVLPVESSIRPEKKGAFRSMLVKTLLSIVAMYGVYGTSGYLAYGSKLTSSTVSVMPAGGFSTFVRLCLAFNVLLTHPLQFCPAIQICDRALKIDPARGAKDPRGVALRLGLNVLLCSLAAMMGPDALELVVAFIGSLCATFIAVILPALLQLRVMAAVRRREGIYPPLQQHAGRDAGSGDDADSDATSAGRGIGQQLVAAVTSRRGATQLWRRFLGGLREDGAEESDPTRARALCAAPKPHGGRPYSRMKLRCAFYAVFGFYVLVVGTTTCVYDALRIFSRDGRSESAAGAAPATSAAAATVAPAAVAGAENTTTAAPQRRTTAGGGGSPSPSGSSLIPPEGDLPLDPHD